ncbi:PREDICTED: exosome complex component RRP46 [Ceratosolen solmsi marchali]|uniref:Exosome complex component RRP46 n=1 Tax=Ceratosolen solmsi marchali TaxID=326594 RepID=A0AAJ6YDY0_9HYME|nr:PREDICTED: exosome complex component RRP46 [Ceratosolen solmsi marchali]
MTENEYSLRFLNCELNYLSVTDGSAIFMQGDTAVIAGVYGPVESKLHKMFYNKANVEASFRPMKGPPSVNDRLMESYIKDVCEASLITSLYPASSISVNIQELEDCGGLLASVINASCLALINSGLAMKFIFAAVCCMIDKESENVIIDPNMKQLNNAKAAFTCVFDNLNKDIICCQTSGRFTEKELLKSIEMCRETVQTIFTFYRDIVTKYATAI